MISQADLVIIGVPTPVTKAKDPGPETGGIRIEDHRTEFKERRYRGPGVHVLSRGNRRDHGANP